VSSTLRDWLESETTTTKKTRSKNRHAPKKKKKKKKKKLVKTATAATESGSSNSIRDLARQQRNPPASPSVIQSNLFTPRLSGSNGLGSLTNGDVS